MEGNLISTTRCRREVGTSVRHLFCDVIFILRFQRFTARTRLAMYQTIDTRTVVCLCRDGGGCLYRNTRENS